MNWRNLVTKNMWRNLRRYLGYLLAATLAVAVFAMFTNFVDNPAIRDAHIATTASQMLVVFRVIVALFAIFFIFYFHAALIRMRSKEFGLLLTLGVTPGQIGRLIFYESLLIGLMSLLVGIGVGIIGSYFFQMAMLAILSLPTSLPFAIPTTTFTTTSIFFGIVFLLEACWIALRVTRRTPRVLLLGARAQQKPPRASWLLVALGIICLGAAYDMALQFSRQIIINMFPIIGLTIIGTYLLFSQCSVMLLKRLRRPDIPGARLLIVARLSQRMKDYARMLTVVTVLNAVVLTGMGALFGVLQIFETQQVQDTPFALQLVVNMAHPSTLTPAQVQQKISQQHFTLQTSLTTTLITGTARSDALTIPVSIMAYSDFVQLQEAERQAHPEIAANQENAPALTSDTQAHVYLNNDYNYEFTLRSIQLKAGKTTTSLQVDTGHIRVINTWHGLSYVGPPTTVVVVTDHLYTHLTHTASPASRWQISSYVLPNWQQSEPIANALHSQLSADQQSLLSDTVTGFDEVKQFLSVMLFADFFISCLFFLAAGSAIYFKLFTQQEEDRHQFHALERLGLQRREAARILNSEFLLLFFVPISLAVIHSIVALLDLANLFRDPTVIPIIARAFAPVCAIYLVCFAVYFWISRVNYLRRMQMVAA